MGNFFDAPWGPLLKGVSAVTTALLVGLAVVSLTPPLDARPVLFWSAGALLLVLPLCALFTIRGYTLEADTLWVHRLCWRTRVPLAGLTSAEVMDGAMRWCVRLAGNGGLYSISGWYWSRKLGRFEAYVTDVRRTVVLRWPKRTVVISPDRPAEFVQSVTRRLAGGV